MRKWMDIFAAAVWALLPGVALADKDAKDGAAALRKPPAGSVASQLDLKFQLLRASSGPLAASLKQNQRDWDNLLPDQREKFRKEAFAFLQKNPKEQDRLIQYYAKFIAMSADKQDAYRRRAEWLKVVVNSFTPEERRKIEEMTPADRAAKLLERRDQLVAEGKLDLGEPTTIPATQPGK